MNPNESIVMGDISPLLSLLHFSATEETNLSIVLYLTEFENSKRVIIRSGNHNFINRFDLISLISLQMFKYEFSNLSLMKVAIVGICTAHKGIDAAIKEIMGEFNGDSIILCEDDDRGIGFEVRATPMRVARKQMARSDLLLGIPKMYEVRRQHLLDEADKVYVIWDGKEEFTKSTIEQLKTMDKLYKVIRLED